MIDETKKDIQEEIILGVPISEVDRQCQAYYGESPFDQPLNPFQDPMDVITEGSKEILGDSNTLKLVRDIYKCYDSKS